MMHSRLCLRVHACCVCALQLCTSIYNICTQSSVREGYEPIVYSSVCVVDGIVIIIITTIIIIIIIIIIITAVNPPGGGS